jgi:hypothetical protein
MVPVKRLIGIIKRYNPKTRDADVVIRRDGKKILLVVTGADARYMSNAIYHMLRALGRRNVRRWTCKSSWCVSFS